MRKHTSCKVLDSFRLDFGRSMDAARRCHRPVLREARHHPLLCISMLPAGVISTNHEFDIAAVHDHLSLLRFLEAGDDGHGLLPAFLPVRFMRKNAHAQAGRLLRVLQLWNSRLSTHPARKRAPCIVESGRPSQVQRPRCRSLRRRLAARGVWCEWLDSS